MTPPKENFSGLPSSSATIQRMGRMKRAPFEAGPGHGRGQDRSWMTRGRISMEQFVGGAAALGDFGGDDIRPWRFAR